VLNTVASEADNDDMGRFVRFRRRMAGPSLAVVLLSGVAGASASVHEAAPAAAATATEASTVTAPCGWRSVPPATYDHVIWVVLENHSYPDVIGPAGSTARTLSPYTNSLAARCGLATNAWGITHPSLPNYLGLLSGSTGGVTTSCTPSTCPQSRSTLFSQLAAKGRACRVYAESMGVACRPSDAYPYVVRHNPPTYFPSLAGTCAGRDVPMGSLTGGRFVTDLANATIPSLSVVIPNQCHNGHDCPVQDGDLWLSRVVPKILASPDYRQGRTALFVTWDEGAGGTRGESCRTTRSRSCHIVTIAVSPTTMAGTRSTTRFDHYSLLETTERMFGITTLLRHAADSGTYSMRKPFRL
jgi:hypothetical protein